MAEPVVVSCVNLKGGVGKTALAVNFAAYCGRSGKKTLLIDLDPQTNATFSCITTDEWETHANTKGTVADLLGARRYASAEDRAKTPEEIVRAAVFSNVDLIPSHLDLFTVDLDLAAATARETKLRRALSGFLKQYDIVVCDCPPNLTIPTQNAIAMSSHYVVPVSPDYLSGIGIGLLVRRVKTLSAALEHEVKHSGIVVSRVGRPAQFREETVAAIRESFPGLVLEAQVSERAAVAESAAKQRSVFDMGNADAAKEFKAVAVELLQRLGVQ